MTDHSRLVEIDAGHEVYVVTFTPDGKYLVSGTDEGVGVWRVRDGKRVALMQMKESIRCVAVSKDGRYIAAGSNDGEVLVWDATTYKRVFARKEREPDIINVIYVIDFSPDSTRLVAASSNGVATIFDFAAGRRVLVLHHAVTWALSAKYSLQGDRIATASSDSVRLWDSTYGRLLADIRISVNPWYGLLWFDNHLFVVANDSKIKRFDTSTGSIIAEWSVPNTDYTPCIALPQHGEYVAYSAGNTIRLWNTSTHTQYHLVSPYNDICSIAFSPDDQLLAIGAEKGKIILTNLSFIQEPEICIDNATLVSWQHDQLASAETLLTAEIPTTRSTAHHVLASRALVRARLERWDTALDDAKKSLKIQPSVMGYIAKCVALVGKGKMDEGCRACDIAFQHFGSNQVTLLLLIKAVVLFMAGKHNDAISRVDDLIAAVFFNSTLHIVQAYMYLLLGNSCMESGDYERAIQSYEHARVKLGDRTDQPPLLILLISGWKFSGLAITIQQRFCEALFAVGRTKEAGQFVLGLVNQEVNMTEPMKLWASDFVQRCLHTPDNTENASGDAISHNQGQVSQEAARVSHPAPLSREWARLRLMTGSWKDALAAAVGFMFPRLTVYQVVCEHLEMTDQLADAIACFHQMHSELAQGVDDEANWALDFRTRCCKKLEDLGDVAMHAKQYDEAISQYTAALSLNPAASQDLLAKRSKACVGKGLWEDALDGANEVIELDPSSPLGYERKYAALQGMGRHYDATDAFEVMLSKMSESPDPEIRERSHHYVSPEQTKRAIRTSIENAIRGSPSVLINTTSGRLCDKSEQAATFESMSTFAELVSSTTTHIDFTRIDKEVERYYRYATFSHTWEDNEPLFDKVTKILVYDLEESPTHHKLQMFCKIVREAGFSWAWSDTCCINKGDHFVLQEALVSMFKWYEDSSMTIVFLLGVDRLAQCGALTRSMWNMRAWTLEEYHASKVVRFYTQDWTPYLGLNIYNHKDSPEIISEMEHATGVSTQALMSLRPGLDDIRQKLRLASTRQTTLVEDAAYSLMGIFSLPLPVVYGEGERALGRLLTQLVTCSGDTSILAWTGISGSFNSCLPASIAVFNQLPTSHIPPAITNADVATTTAGLPLIASATKLYDRLTALPVPFFVGRRMKLPCLVFKLGRLSVSQNGSELVFCAKTNVLGSVEIRTEEDLSQLDSLYLVHPWIDYLLDRHPVGNVTEVVPMKNMDDLSPVLGESPSFPDPSNVTSTSRQTRTARLLSRLGQTFGGRLIHPPLDTPSLQPPTVLLKEKQTLQFLVRLGQPFGVLLLTRARRNAEEYRRVAAASSIRAQMEITQELLDRLVYNVQVLDVL